MLRKGDEHLANQKQYEDRAQAKLFDARQKRQEERDRMEAQQVVSPFFIVSHTDCE